jgi:hypothetical protein
MFPALEHFAIHAPNPAKKCSEDQMVLTGIEGRLCRAKEDMLYTEFVLDADLSEGVSEAR